jgi:hypothetical protein
MEDFITTEYNFELQQLEKQIDEQQKSTSAFGQGEFIATKPKASQTPLRPTEDDKITNPTDGY